MYTLYFKRSERVIEIKKAKKAFQNLEFPGEVIKYNDCYFICAKRKPLVDKAEEIKQKWILELEEALKLITEIEIK